MPTSLPPFQWVFLDHNEREFILTIHEDGKCDCFDPEAAINSRPPYPTIFTPEILSLVDDPQAGKQIEKEREEFSVSMNLPQDLVALIRKVVDGPTPMSADQEKCIDELLLPYFNEHARPFLNASS